MHRGTLQGDVEWYRRKAVESGGPVLELGRGYGACDDSNRRSGHSRRRRSIWTRACSTGCGRRRRRWRRTYSVAPVGASRRHALVCTRRAVRAGHHPVPCISAQLDARRSTGDAATCARAPAPGGRARPERVSSVARIHGGQRRRVHAGVWRWRETARLPDGRLRRLFRGQPLRHRATTAASR